MRNYLETFLGNIGFVFVFVLFLLKFDKSTEEKKLINLLLAMNAYVDRVGSTAVSQQLEIQFPPNILSYNMEEGTWVFFSFPKVTCPLLWEPEATRSREHNSNPSESHFDIFTNLEESDDHKVAARE